MTKKKPKPYMPTKAKSVEWSTDQKLFDELNKKYGPFDLDVAASQDNAKCDRFFTNKRKLDPDKPKPAGFNGLRQPWNCNRAWCNPPGYNSRSVYKWVEKAWLEILKGRCKELACCLLPSKTGSVWFHELVYHKTYYEFLKGRQQFDNQSNKVSMSSHWEFGWSATFDSVVVVIQKPIFNVGGISFLSVQE